MSVCDLQARKVADHIRPDAGLPLRAPDAARILIVSDDANLSRRSRVGRSKVGPFQNVDRSHINKGRKNIPPETVRVELCPFDNNLSGGRRRTSAAEPTTRRAETWSRQVREALMNAMQTGQARMAEKNSLCLKRRFRVQIQ